MPENEVFSNLNHMLQEIKEFTPEEQQELIDCMREIAEPRLFQVFAYAMEIIGITAVT